ncbi:MAG: TIGR00304 family membrane protein [Candidatus Baldrarchaeia archaeon]
MTVLCELCGERPAKYVCQECGRRVCQYCFDTYYEVCNDCFKAIGEHTELLSVERGINVDWMLKFVIIGFVIMFLGMIIIAITSLTTISGASGTFFIFIGPIPIIFGYGSHASYLLILSILIFVIFLFLFFYWYKQGSVEKIEA